MALNGVTTDYILISPENAEGCMLIKGSLDSANLRESWFSVEIDSTNDKDRPDISYCATHRVVFSKFQRSRFAGG